MIFFARRIQIYNISSEEVQSIPNIINLHQGSSTLPNDHYRRQNELPTAPLSLLPYQSRPDAADDSREVFVHVPLRTSVPEQIISMTHFRLQFCAAPILCCFSTDVIFWCSFFVMPTACVYKGKWKIFYPADHTRSPLMPLLGD